VETYNASGGSTVAVSVPRRRFTVDEYYAMAKHGILKPDERVELLDGEIVPMNPIGSPHAWCVTDLTDIFAPLIGQIILRIQNPLRLDSLAEPEPDITILRSDAPRNRHPGPAETLLVIEVADTSLRKDRGQKLRMYARAGIFEYWIVDLNAERIEVYRDPLRSRYRSVRLLRPGDTVSPIFAPDLTIEVSTVLGNDRPET
jgi:Uma2 family endonuclease